MPWCSEITHEKSTSLKHIPTLSLLTLWHPGLVSAAGFFVSPGLTGRLLPELLLELSELSDQTRALSGGPATQEWVTLRHSWHHIWWQTIWLMLRSLHPPLTTGLQWRPPTHALTCRWCGRHQPRMDGSVQPGKLQRDKIKSHHLQSTQEGHDFYMNHCEAFWTALRCLWLFVCLDSLFPALNVYWYEAVSEVHWLPLNADWNYCSPDVF